MTLPTPKTGEGTEQAHGQAQLDRRKGRLMDDTVMTTALLPAPPRHWLQRSLCPLQRIFPGEGGEAAWLPTQTHEFCLSENVVGAASVGPSAEPAALLQPSGVLSGKLSRLSAFL